MKDDDDLSKYFIPDDQIPVRRVIPAKIRKRREQFVMLPWLWIEKLKGAHARAWFLAAVLLHLHWKGRGEPIKLANGMLRFDGMSRATKWRALRDLERLGLITVECRPRRSPLVRVLV
jgi:hypothetical protein